MPSRSNSTARWLTLNRALTQSGTFSVITPKSRDGKLDPDALYCIRHTAEHVMTEAICRLWPETKLVYGPPVEDGAARRHRPEHKISGLMIFRSIEAEMAKIVADEDRPMTRYELSREEGFKKIEAEGNPYKLENAKSAKGDVLSFYVTGANLGTDFEDLCMGPHVPSTGKIGAFKITAVAGAYFRGDEKAKQLQRIYGTAFPTKKELDEHFARIEEAKKRDHRVIGKQMGLFTMSPLVGQGLVLWMPKGGIIRTELQNLMQGELTKRGYSPVFTPHIGHVDLYKTSGHFPYYKDSQYPTIKSETDPHEEYLLKPMNCPHHCMIYAAEQRSYRDLPVARPGPSSGLCTATSNPASLNAHDTRARPDAVTTCAPGLRTPEQRRRGRDSQQRSISSKRDLRRAGVERLPRASQLARSEERQIHGRSRELGEGRSDSSKRVATEMHLPHEAVEGEAAFYGPKLDFMVKDCIGREWQLGTVQLDYNLPERFKLEYIGQDNSRHRPVMIHRAPFGSFERFTGILIEHFAGAFPLWLSPVQVRVANNSETSQEAARRTAQTLRLAGVRVEEDISAAGNIKQRVKDSEEAKVPYLLVVGDREAAANTVAVRGRGRKDLGVMPVDAFVAKVKQEIAERT